MDYAAVVQTGINVRRSKRRRPYPPMPDKIVPVGAVFRHVLDGTKRYPGMREPFRHRLAELVMASPDWREMQRRAWELFNDFEDALGGMAQAERGTTTIDRRRDRAFVNLNDFAR